MAWLAALLVTPVAQAHGFGPTTSEPFVLPAWVTWVSGASVVGLSFLLIAAFVRRAGRETPSETRPPRSRAWVSARRAFTWVLLAAYALACAPAFRSGSASPLPGAILWVGLWALLPMLAYTAGDAWAVASPLRALAPLADKLRGARRAWRYPARLGSWPSVVLLLGVAALETAGRNWASGANLARFLLAYGVASFAGMALFGAETWLGNVEVLDRVVRLFSALSPRHDGRWRWPWRGLLDVRLATGADVAFVVALLFEVNLDALLQTPWGVRAVLDLAAQIGLPQARLVALAAGFCAFLALFVACAARVGHRAESLQPTRKVAARLGASLLPIAAAYHAAHNAPYVLRSFWPQAIPAGGALGGVLGTAQLALILAGHVAAVAAGHELALAFFPSRIQAFRGEVALSAAMVAYTLVGLAILTQAGQPLGGAGA